ncbi:MAG: hypothetical protein NT003_00565 [Candidatus Magasanikbacteria bacterium]|nr:hypothetical protein [Candidatus Magasanikbacteria bacterium]
MPSLDLKNRPRNFDWQAIRHTAEVESQDDEDEDETPDFFMAPSGDDYDIDYSDDYDEDEDSDEDEDEDSDEDEDEDTDEDSDENEESGVISQKNRERIISFAVSFFSPFGLGFFFGPLAKVIMWQHRKK